jgi:hypothetical protein
MRFARIGEVVALVRGGQPHAGLGAVVEHDLLGETKAERLLEELAIGLDVRGQAVEVVKPAHVHAPARDALRLILQGGPQIFRRLVPLGLVVDLQQVAVRIVELVGRTMAQFALVPTDPEARLLQRRDPALQRLRAARPERRVTQAGRVRPGQLKRVALVIVPASEIHRLTLPSALGHAEYVHEEAQRFVRLRRQELDMAEMGHVHDRFVVQWSSPSGNRCSRTLLLFNGTLRRLTRHVQSLFRVQIVDWVIASAIPRSASSAM